ncbi:DUF1890 domain-containing protein [Methanococcus maripaludis]|uniref:DUF1890 domain-containing protein n=2 Tax=Methanococcus maripaludis TaxID=39152 RepID=A0A7J9PMF1_METMI|nr:DUF1890 domain-containing protein [Methanococcus maripaludis]MBA2862679.1 hypothetical protein [Methanococcus maripaludis]
MRIMIILGCPEPPVLVPSFMFLLNMLKNKGHEIIVSANPAALKLIESVDPEKYYLKGIGFQPIDEGLKNKAEVDYIFGFAHNDAAVNYIITYKMTHNVDTSAIVFGKEFKDELVQILTENGVNAQMARAFHNPTPLNVKLKKIFSEF